MNAVVAGIIQSDAFVFIRIGIVAAQGVVVRMGQKDAFKVVRNGVAT